MKKFLVFASGILVLIVTLVIQMQDLLPGFLALFPVVIYALYILQMDR